MPRYHHLESDHARLSASARDLAVETVRDANEVLFESRELTAADLIVAARAICEAELLFERNPDLLAETSRGRSNDWLLACTAHAYAGAELQLRERGAKEASEHARASHLGLLQQIAKSPFRSPLLNYTSVLSELIQRSRPSELRQRVALHQHYIAEDLYSQRGANVLGALHDIAEARLKLGEAERAFDLFTRLLRFDPTEIWIHVRLAHTLSDDFPEVALAAAERAILLLPREDKHQLRPQLKRTVEETRGRAANALPVLARSLLLELQAIPSKRPRSSLRTLCSSAEPEIEYAPTKQREPLPDVAALAQLRRELQTLPRPLPTLAQQRTLPPIAAQSTRKVGRNDPCPCGSGAKYKRCCAAPTTGAQR